MSRTFRNKVLAWFRRRGIGISLYPDITSFEHDVLDRIVQYTMTSIDRQLALIRATQHVLRAGIPGCLVECGCWRGGSAMAMALVCMQEKDIRDLYLYDTFTGMPCPTEEDGKLAAAYLGSRAAKGDPVSLEEVRTNVIETWFPASQLYTVPGRVEDTIPKWTPGEEIALLRLDTDWYSSTKHELENLFHLVSPGGVIIIDDYGYWDGARKAVDEFLGDDYLLHRIDNTGRILVKR